MGMAVILSVRLKMVGNAVFLLKSWVLISVNASRVMLPIIAVLEEFVCQIVHVSVILDFSETHAAKIFQSIFKE
jgi:hypothetical protein